MFNFDKQPTLSFQNITQTMKINKSRKDGLCFVHHDKPAKYKDQQSQILYCKFCAVQVAARGGKIQDFPKKINTLIDDNLSILDEIYQDTQKRITSCIKRYKQKYHRLQQTITEMYINDFQLFNKKLQQNNSLFTQLKSINHKKWNKNQLTNKFEMYNHETILDKIDTLQQYIDNFKYQMANDKKNMIGCYYQSPVIHQKHTFQISDNKKLKISNASIQSRYVSQNNKQNNKQCLNISQKSYKHSYGSKNNSTVEQIKKSYEDTPQSVKSRLSNNCLKVTTGMAVTMFQKIDICQSINMTEGSDVNAEGSGGVHVAQGSGAGKNEGKKDSCLKMRQSLNSSYSSSIKNKYRYGGLNESQQHQT